MDLMAEINAYRFSPEQVRARQARRDARRAMLYDRIKLAAGLPSAEQEQQRLASGWNLDNDHDVSEGSPIGSQHPGAAALLVVRQALGAFHLPTNVALRFGGMKRASGHSAYSMDEGVIIIHAKLRSLSGPHHEIEVPVLVREGRVYSPSLVFHNGVKRVLAQSTLDDIINGGEFKQLQPDRSTMYSPPPDRDAAAQPRRQVPLLRPGLFAVPPSRNLIASAVKGFVPRQGFYSPDVTGLVEPGQLGQDIPGAEQSDIDVGERPVEGFAVGQKVRLKHNATTRDRGGVAYELPKGTRGVVLRDVDGAQWAYYVRFDELGITAVVPREAMA